MSETISITFEFKIGDVVYYKMSNHDHGSRPVQMIVYEQLAQTCHADTQRLYRVSSVKEWIPEILLSLKEPAMRIRSDESIAEEARMCAIETSFRQEAEDIRWVASRARRAAEKDEQK